jgi:hypothetical protein
VYGNEGDSEQAVLHIVLTGEELIVRQLRWIAGQRVGPLEHEHVDHDVEDQRRVRAASQAERSQPLYTGEEVEG